MPTTVHFQGTSPIEGSDDQLWTYEVLPDRVASTGSVTAILPLGDPAAFPGVPEPAGTFPGRDTGASGKFAGPAVETPGTQVVSFKAASAREPAELLLVVAEPGQRWAGNSYVTVAVTSPELTQALPAPAVTHAAPVPPPALARPVTDFSGSPPYASEVFGVYQPLAGWLGRKVSRGLAAHRERLDGY